MVLSGRGGDYKLISRVPCYHCCCSEHLIFPMTYDVLIIGGGLVGASLAAALKPSGLSVALVEAQPMLRRQ